MTWTMLISLFLTLVAIAATVTGYNLISGRWEIPTNRQGKVTTIAILSTFALGILSVLMTLHPAWAEKLSQPIRKIRET